MSFDKIRKADLDDFNSISLLLQQLWPSDIININELYEVYKLSINRASEFAICYCQGKKIVGFAAGNIQNAFYRTGNLCYVGVLIIDSEYRGHGIGIELMDYIKNIAVKNNCKAIELESGFHRKKAHDFYENYGFKKTAFTFALELV